VYIFLFASILNTEENAMLKKQPKTFYTRTYGCQMNELDTDLIAGKLIERGLTMTAHEEEADLLIYNTCSIRDHAERKVMGKLGRSEYKIKSDKIIGITGCMANAKKSALFEKLPHLDFIIGTNNIHNINHVLDDILLTGEKQCLTDPKFHHELDYKMANRKESVTAFVSIIRGCNKFCTYCVVPYTRGPEVSREADSIIEECKMLADKGYKEVTLLGQNVNSYGKDHPEWNFLFHDLLARIDKETSIERVRFMTSHPVDITKELMEAIRDLNSLCEFVHFPLQSGSDRILKKMHRLYSVADYVEKVTLLRAIIPGVSLGTDIIVGFPTETEAEFEETYQMIKEIQYSVGFFFSYSPRKGTPAMRWKDDIPEEVKQERLQRLLSLQQEITVRQRQNLIGSTMPILFEKVSERDPLLIKGRTRCWQNVLVPGDSSLIGTTKMVKINSCNHQTLLGEV
jgi:tRNA-2-methylthio-N6-dimethylallyladenosine synthase